MKTILVAGTYDTKDDELGYLAGVIRAQGGVRNRADWPLQLGRETRETP
jgi:uncharacterized protein (UPF0261 family)